MAVVRRGCSERNRSKHSQTRQVNSISNLLGYNSSKSMTLSQTIKAKLIVAIVEVTEPKTRDELLKENADDFEGKQRPTVWMSSQIVE